MSVMLALDFGDQFCKVAIARTLSDGKAPEGADISFLHPILPSLLALGKDHTIKIGLDAQAHLDRGESVYTVIGSFKRLGGSVVGGKIPAVVRIGDEQDTFESQTPNTTFSSVQITAIFLSSIFKLVSSIAHCSVTKAVITIPTWFTVAQRDNLIYAFKMTGLTHVGIMTEATASLIDYALAHSNPLGSRDQCIVLIDIGHVGSTVTVAMLGNNKADVKNTTSITSFGGQLIDLALYDYLKGLVMGTDQATIFMDMKPSGKILADCQRVKEAICLSGDMFEAVHFSAPFEQVSIMGDELAKLLGPMHQLSALVLKSLALANITLDQIYKVVVLGSSSEFPTIKDEITGVFARGTFISSASPMAIARGAIYAGSLFKSSGYHEFHDEALSDMLTGQGISPWKGPIKLPLQIPPIEQVSKFDCSTLEKQYTLAKNPTPLGSASPQTTPASQLVDHEHQILLDDLAEKISISQQILDTMSDSHSEKLLCIDELTALLLKRAAITPNIEDLTLALSVQSKAVTMATTIMDKAKILNSIAIIIKQVISIKPEMMNMLNQGILSLQMAETLAVGDDKNRAKYLNNLSNLVHLCYQNGFNIEDLNLAIETQKRALDLMPENKETRSTFLHIYGLMLETRFDKLSNLPDLKEAASVLEIAGKIASPTDVQKPAYFFNFGVTLKKLFNQLRNKADLDNSILHQQMAIKLASDTDKQKPMFCCHLGETLQNRFFQNWMLEDLDNAIKYYLQAAKLVDKGSQSKPVYLNQLGEAFGIYSIYKESAPHLDHAILFQRRAVELAPLKNRALFLRNLAKLLETRFHGPSGNSMQDLEEAIIFRQQAAVLTPYFHPEKEQHIANLAVSQYFSYKHSHNMEALASAISTQKELVQFSSEVQNQDQEKHSQYIFDLGRFLQMKFDEDGSIEGLNEAIKQLNKAITTAKNNSNKAQYLSHLGTALFTKFEYLHDMIDLEASITSTKQAIHLAADDDLNRLSYINNHAQAMVLHFATLGNAESLEIAMGSYEKIVADTPDEHPSKALRLSNLGVAQMALFQHNGKISDLQKAIFTSQAAVDQGMASGLNKFTYLGNLANALLAHWQYIGDNIENLDQAIRIEQKIVDDIPDGHLDKPKHLSNLGNALSIHYEALGEVFDLNNGLYYQSKAIEGVPIGHSQRPLYLNNLGTSFKQRFARKNKLEDLKTAIKLFQEAVELTSDTNINKWKYLYNLASAFITSFNFTNDIQDLETSVLHQEISLQLTPSEHPSQIFKLAAFGYTLRQQANYWKDLSGLEKSLAFFQKSLSLMTTNHPEKIKTLLMQSQAFEDIFEITQDQKYLQKALENYKQAMNSQPGLPLYHFAAALRWTSHAIKYDRKTCMEAYTCAFELLPQLAWFGLSIEAQFERLYSAQSFVSDATAHALHLGNVDLAIEWLEHGRSVVWSQVLQLRQPLDHLKKANPTLAEKIETLSKNLSHHQTYNASYFTDKGLQEASAYETSIGTQHRLAKSLEILLKEAQEDPEFRYLSGNKPISFLKEAASQGPVVILNASKLQCDAIIIVSPSLPLLYLPLHQTSYDKIQNIQQKLSNLLMHGLGLRDGLATTSDRHGGPAKRHTSSADDVFRHVLKELWITIVKPVIDLLQLNLQSNTTEIPHIWWCPTSHFTFLPIHAAGIYDQSENATVTLADYAVSSYIPNLGALLNARQRNTESRSPKFLVVAQADTPGQCALPGVYHELALMHEILPQPFELIDGPKATMQSVLAAIKNSSWVHFSCHGKQDMNVPTLSGLHLHDGVLSLRQIIREAIPDAEFAFLSACQTASGDYGHPDEALHLAGGMMLAGFRSVIATMWSVGDQDAPVITEEVYKYLFRNDAKKPNGLEGAAALRVATQKLRKQYQNKSFASWVPFIHIGV